MATKSENIDVLNNGSLILSSLLPSDNPRDAFVESLLETVKTKKETYLDSLISNQFVAKEREMINSKIDEFTIQEKQFKGSMSLTPNFGPVC